jgi:phenylpyruvate tautomerase PptA (4-oxalocrotonate tautomerase family)
MPIIRISALPPRNPTDVSNVLGAVCDAVARAANMPAHHIWATWNELKPGHFVEADKPADTIGEATHPPLVEVIAYEGKSADAIEKILTAVADTLVAELQLAPGNVFITYTEARANKTYTGGKIRGR